MNKWGQRIGNQLAQLDYRATTSLTLSQKQGYARSPWRWLASVGAHLGDSLLWLGITGFLWWRAGYDTQRKKTLVAWLFSLLVTLGATLYMKGRFKRQRPGQARFLYGRGADVHSFPSGHGVRAGLILSWATLLSPRWGKGAPILALWIVWSRVALGIHYVGDVVVGLLLGVLMGRWLRWINTRFN